MNWGVEKFLHGRMSRPEFFEPENPIKSYIVIDNCWCTVHVFLNFNFFQIISLITPQAKIDSLQPVAEIIGEDRRTVPPKVLMGSSDLTDPHHVGLQHLGLTFKPSISKTIKPGIIINPLNKVLTKQIKAESSVRFQCPLILKFSYANLYEQIP